jgi:hypothetical protein
MLQDYHINCLSSHTGADDLNSVRSNTSSSDLDANCVSTALPLDQG